MKHRPGQQNGDVSKNLGHLGKNGDEERARTQRSRISVYKFTICRDGCI
jgi:hypothetical protein